MHFWNPLSAVKLRNLCGKLITLHNQKYYTTEVIRLHNYKSCGKYYTINSRYILGKVMPEFNCFDRTLHSNAGQRTVTLKDGDRASEIRLISQEDVDKFSDVTGDHNPIHIMQNERPSIVHGALLNGLVSGVIGTKLPGPGTMVISQTLQFPNPCYAGEQVKITVEIISVRKIISCKFNCVVNRECEVVVLLGEAKLIPAKEHP